MLTVALAASLAALVAGSVGLPPPGPLAVVRVPDEPGAIVLPDGAPTLQTVAADLDGDGERDVVRLVEGEAGTVWIEAWAQDDDDAWRLVAQPALAVPGEAGQAERAYVGRPIRLLVRRVDGLDRVSLVRQPEFAEPEDPRECCVLIDDLELSGTSTELVRVAEPGPVADSIHVIDLDGDGTDELLAAFSLPPLGDASTPTEARVYRWSGSRFGPPTTTELPVGSGSTLFVLGDSDGVPGDEAAVISSSALNVLFRIGLGPDDRLVAEDSALIVSDALAVPLGVRRRGLAVLSSSSARLQLLSWPRGGPPRPPTSERRAVEETADLIGTIQLDGVPQLLVHRAELGVLQVFTLPDLDSVAGPIAPSDAAYAVAAGPLEPYVGPLPGGGPDGEPAAIVAGRLLPAPRLDDPATPIGALAGASPAGLVGHDRAWLAIQQGMVGSAPLDPRGGRLEPPVFHPGSAVAIAPLSIVAAPEGNGGAHEPTTTGTVTLETGVTGVAAEGLVARVRAPSGSRVYLSMRRTPIPPGPMVVGEAGSQDVVVEPPSGATGDDPREVTMTVATPAGHAYVTSWNIGLFQEAPDLSARTETPLGSSRVTVVGRSDPYAEVEVAGSSVAVDEDGRFSGTVELPPWPTAVTVEARDPIGNEASLIVTGVGVFDYRALPWIPIALLALGAIAIVLILRVPKPRISPRPVGDDAVLEELDPADRL